MNDCLKNNFFPDILETAEITPCFKKGDKNEKENYRPVSILPNVLKGFERLIYNQLNEFIERKFSKFLLAFQKNHNTQYALLIMIENWNIGVIIMDLSKALGILNRNLLVAKLKADGLNSNAASFIKIYFTNRHQNWGLV